MSKRVEVLRQKSKEAAAVEDEVGDDALQDSLSSRGGVLLLELFWGKLFFARAAPKKLPRFFRGTP